ncbi:MAG: flagellar biosynthetic protein FliR [Chlamydiae bacterium]|nr:flagellar biosynthetic protein FliR [Chlamydiota bacterium]
MEWIDPFTWLQILQMYLLVLCRIGPIIAFTPFLGGKIVPASGRAGLLVFLSIIFLPYTDFNATPDESVTFFTVFYALKEILIGFTISFFASIPFFVAQSAGIIIDFARGSSQLMAQDPTLQNQASTIGIMFNYVLIALFFMIKGPEHFFEAIALSFEKFPLYGSFPPELTNLKSHLWVSITAIIQVIFTLSLKLAAPAIIAILMAEMFLGIANRLAPQVQIAFLGMPLKSFLGLLLLFVGWFAILGDMKELSDQMLQQISTFFAKKN